MKKTEFQLRPTSAYIELIKLLKFMQIAQTGGHAKMMVEKGIIKVNGEEELRKRKKLRPGDIVVVSEMEITIVGSSE